MQMFDKPDKASINASKRAKISEPVAKLMSPVVSIDLTLALSELLHQGLKTPWLLSLMFVNVAQPMQHVWCDVAPMPAVLQILTYRQHNVSSTVGNILFVTRSVLVFEDCI